MSDRRNFHGNDEKLGLMKNFQVFPAPSVRHGWGLVVTEANDMGTQVVGYDVPGLHFSLNVNDPGLLADSDSKLMASQAEKLLSSQLLQELSGNALEDSRNCFWTEITDRIEARLLEGAA